LDLGGHTVAQELIRDCSVRKKWGFPIVGSIGVLALFFAPALLPSAHAQNAEKTRRVVQHVAPEYPVSLRAAHVAGLVRLSITISPSGNVTKIDLLGGNAIFSDSAIRAVKKWKYAPAATETTNEVQIRFNPDAPDKP
jgi:TonB family protein